MAWYIWALIALVPFIIGAGLLAWSLCAMASDSDERLEDMARANNARRNGIGRP